VDKELLGVAVLKCWSRKVQDESEEQVERVEEKLELR